MVLNPDCVRDILLEVESLGFDECLTINLLHERLPVYSSDQLEYTCLMLEDGGFLELITIETLGRNLPGVKLIQCLTYKGHEFLANVHKDDIWAGVKSVSSKIGSASLSALTQIASNVISEIIKAQFGLSSPGAV
ncbi:MAG: DUF2513 domain-containing protein [Oscillospiraceae bacterium]|uniref:DUF2513 domain-containing protein n=1 Tax=Intestinimonas sp. UBA1698 TaxID=1946651 RepID=UPI001D3CB240|nr:DUF2513 domain-containing protein [Intestinimonas sp. UBA1698]MBS6283704.1 DUF2513 domain-containing protein [Oscillospiraceae bacterium]